MHRNPSTSIVRCFSMIPRQGWLNSSLYRSISLSVLNLELAASNATIRIYNVHALVHVRHLSPKYRGQTAYTPRRLIPRGLVGWLVIALSVVAVGFTGCGFLGSCCSYSGRQLITRLWEQPALCTLCKPSRWKINRARAQSTPG